MPGEYLGDTDKAKHRVRLRLETKLVYIPASRLPHTRRRIMDEKAKNMLGQSFTQPSRLSWNSILFLVPKNDGQFRPVIEFWIVNEVTQDPQYPLPVLSDLLIPLGHGNTIFSSLDLHSRYWQVPMAPTKKNCL